MKKLSIIFGFKNRDCLRVKRCLNSLAEQTYNDFEVIFIDYGSDLQISENIKSLLEEYHFVRYYFSDARGYPWNRSHALNIGVRVSVSEYILFADVDLIYSPNSIEALMDEASESCAVYSPIYFLNKSFNRWEALYSTPLSYFDRSEDTPIGAVYLVNREVIENIRGFDEFYCFWGVEDRDLRSRLELYGLRHTSINIEKYPIYHQWHAAVSNRGFNFFPEKWWDELNLYFQWNAHVIRRNGEDWGQLVSKRPINNTVSIPFEVNYRTVDSYKKAQIISDLVEKLKHLNENEHLHIIIKKEKLKFIYITLIRYMNAFLRKIFCPIGIDLMSNVERDSFSYLARDLFFIVWHLINKEKAILDYEFIDSDNSFEIKLLLRK